MNELNLTESLNSSELKVYGITFKAVRASHNHGYGITAYGPWQYYVNGKGVDFWEYDPKTGHISIIDKSVSYDGFIK